MDVQITCPCPPAGGGDIRHPDGDTVTLRDRLDFRQATTIRKAIGLLNDDSTEDAESAEVLAVMTEWYLLLGVESWTLADPRGKPVPVSRTAIRGLLEDPGADEQIAVLSEAADSLYMKQVLLPLLVRASRSSPPTPTDASTSVPKGSTATRPKPSKPSSITSIPTAATARTSSLRDGDSSTSRSAASAS